MSLRDFLDIEIQNARLIGNTASQHIMTALARRYSTGDGATLAELFSGIAPASDMMLLSSVDEATKDKSTALLNVADAVEFQSRALKTLGKNLLTPAVATPIVGFLCVLTSQIISSIVNGAPASIWTGFNGFVRQLAAIIEAHWVNASLGAVAAIIALIWCLPRWTGRSRLFFDTVPGFSLYRDYNSAVVLSAMSMMLGAGKTLTQSLEDMSKHANPWLKWHLRRILLSLEESPNDYIAAFGYGLMSKQIRARMASLMGSSKSFTAALVSLGTTEVKRLESNINVASIFLSSLLLSALLSVAVVLSMGQMTIASALQKATDPARIQGNR
jgi:hypothetical protein